MEVKEVKFHEELLTYFEGRRKECTGFDLDAVSNIVNGLKRLVKVEQGSGREKITVSISHKLGPFGFEIKQVQSVHQF